MKTRLKKINPRYPSAIIAVLLVIPVFVAIIIGGFGGRIFGSIAMIVAAMYGVYEFIKHMKLHKATKIIVPFLAIAVFMLDKDFVMIPIIRDGFHNKMHLTSMFNVYTICVPVVALTVTMLDPVARKQYNLIKSFVYITFIVIASGLFFRVLFSMSVIDYRFILLLIPIAIISDTFAYTGGMLLGKKLPKKMAPKISPKKTWIGFAFGYVFAVIYVILFIYFTGILEHVDQISHGRYIALFTLSVIVLPLISPVGDLVFSAFKRDMKVKDYGNIMPGHGGLLDRIDSWIFIVISFTLIYQMLVW